MHDPSNTVPVAAALEPLDESRALYLTALLHTAPRSFHLTHPYFELVYAPALGPSATLLGRYLGRVLATHGDEKVQLCPAALSLELGLRSSSGDPLGERSLLRRAIERLEHNRVARWIEPQHLGMYVEVPPVSDRVRDKLPTAARRAHDQFLGVIDLRDGRPAAPTGPGPAVAGPAATAPREPGAR
jgi:hypothetical protein